MTEHKEHSAVSVRLEKRTNEFEIGFKQIQVSFKIYSNLQYFLTSAESYEGSCAKKYQNHILSSFAYKLVYLMINLVKQLFSAEEKVLLINLLKKFLKSMNTVKK